MASQTILVIKRETAQYILELKVNQTRMTGQQACDLKRPDVISGLTCGRIEVTGRALTYIYIYVNE